MGYLGCQATQVWATRDGNQLDHDESGSNTTTPVSAFEQTMATWQADVAG